MMGAAFSTAPANFPHQNKFFPSRNIQLAYHRRLHGANQRFLISHVLQ